MTTKMRSLLCLTDSVFVAFLHFSLKKTIIVCLVLCALVAGGWHEGFLFSLSVHLSLEKNPHPPLTPTPQASHSLSPLSLCVHDIPWPWELNERMQLCSMHKN